MKHQSDSSFRLQENPILPKAWCQQLLIKTRRLLEFDPQDYPSIPPEEFRNHRVLRLIAGMPLRSSFLLTSEKSELSHPDLSTTTPTCHSH